MAATRAGCLNRRVSYAIHWVSLGSSLNSVICDDLDRVAKVVKELNGRKAYLIGDPVVERVISSDLTVEERKKLGVLLGV